MTTASFAAKHGSACNIPYRSWCESARKRFWKANEWARFPNLRAHSYDNVQRRIRHQAYTETLAATLFTAHPSLVSRTYIAMWIVMLRRHEGVPVFDGTAPLEYAESHRVMDHLGEHAAGLCPRGLGWNDRHKAVANVLGKDLVIAAKVDGGYEMEYLLPGLNERPANFLLQPGPNTTQTLPLLTVAYDSTVVLPFQESLKSMGARTARAVANAADKRTAIDLTRKLAAIPGEALQGRSRLGWTAGPSCRSFSTRSGHRQGQRPRSYTK